jgi:hypothetical protein
MAQNAKALRALSSGSNSFPDFEETEYEGSVLRMPVYQDGKLVETLALRALLKVDRYVPTTVLGHRQFEFLIREWEVIGKSKAFGGWLSYNLSDTPQPKSVCRAVNADSDYPALIVYCALYDLYLNSKRVYANVPGLGIGKDVTEIPPRGIPVGFQKPFASGGLVVEAGMCTEMFSLGIDEYNAEVAEIRALREGRLSEPSALKLPTA